MKLLAEIQYFLYILFSNKTPNNDSVETSLLDTYQIEYFIFFNFKITFEFDF